MSKLKKVLAMVLACALVATIAIGGTVAYLTQDAGDETNVFSVGNIDVSLDEKVGIYGEGGEVKETESGAEYIEVMPGDYLKKEVTVTNEGKTDAYVAVTVMLNNADKINAAIDDVYEKEPYNYTAQQIQAIYDDIFDGWGINYNPRPGAYGISDARGVIDGFFDLPEHVLHVDFAKTTKGSTVIGANNWFIAGSEKAGQYWVDGPKAYDGYYTADMDDYEICYTYYIYLPAGESTTLFNGLNVPAEFDNEQIKMFDGLELNVEAKAIQADNMAVAAEYADDEDGKAKTAFAILAGDMDVPEDYTNNPNNWDTWDGTADTSWYNDTDTEFTLTTAEQLAGLAELVDDGNTFEGKTVNLDKNIDLEVYDTEGNLLCFDPIGSYRSDTAFKGIFNGQGYTIKNLNQNTWELDNGYYYGDLGLGLFGLVEDATIQDLTMDGARISGESALSGIVAAAAYGDCTFENITVTNSQTADYQYYAGGIVAWASGNHKYINCDVDATTTIAAQWGDFDNSTGGIIGGAGGSATIYLKDCDVACRIDAYNDVTSSYQWYAYRRCGMLIGNTSKTEEIDGTTYAAAPQLTCENVTVTYGEWANNYTYCEFAGKNWPYVRVQAGVSNSAYSNPRYGHPTDANGNEVVDDNHVHNEGEDHFILCVFDQLYGGGQGVYGTATHDGVTVNYNNK